MKKRTLLFGIILLTALRIIAQPSIFYSPIDNCDNGNGCVINLRSFNETESQLRSGSMECDVSSDSLELVNFYNVLEGVNWEFQDGWLKNNLVDWYGIELTNEGCVRNITTYDYYNHDNGLKGDMPVMDLPELTGLYLSFSELHLNINGATCFTKMPKLRSLFVYEAVFDGPWPNLANCPEISSLGFSFTQIRGTIPSFSITPNLRFLEGIGNGLTGTIPDVSQHNFSSFNLGRNDLEGPIPDFSNSTILRSLSLYNNMLTDTLPHFLSNLMLEGLYLQRNQLTGTIPNYTHLTNLEVLNLAHNQFIGVFPQLPKENLKYLILNDNELQSIVPDLSDLIAIKEIDISNNRYTFEHLLPNINSIPEEYIYYPQKPIYKDTTINLEEGKSLTIDLNIDSDVSTNVYRWFKDDALYQTINGDNKLTFNALKFEDAGIYTVEVTNAGAPLLTLESYPIEINIELNCRTKDSLVLVDLWEVTHENGDWEYEWNFDEPIDNWWGVCLNQEGCVSSLEFDGTTPCDNSYGFEGMNLKGEIPNFKFNQLRTIRFNGNKITKIPDFTEIPNLVKLNLSINDISEIPDLSNTPKLEYLTIQSNPIKELPDFSNLPNLMEILAHNTDISEIPDFSSLPNLQSLRMSSSKIRLFPDFSNLPQLLILNLRNNNISHPIPDFSDNCPGLAGINVSNNLLTFEDLLPSFDENNELTIKNKHGFANTGVIDSFIYAPQKNIFQDTIIILMEDEDFILDLLIDEDIPDNEYKWIKDGQVYKVETGNNNLEIPKITLNDEGTYTVEITNPNAPDLTLYSYPINIIVEKRCEISLAFEETLPTCGEENGSIELAVTGNNNAYSISWANNLGNSLNLNNLKVGEYTVTITQDNCELIETIVLQENAPAINFAELDIQDISCPDQENGILSVLAVEGGIPPYEYSLNESDFQSNAVFTNLASGVYNIELKDANNCTFKTTETINTPPLLQLSLSSDKTEGIPGETIEITSEVRNGVGDISYFWESDAASRMNCTDCENIEVSPDITTTYKLTIRDENGCSASASVEIYIESCQGEENFLVTPNGDGHNDYLEFNCPNEYASDKFELIITDRWGSQVYRSEPYQNEWNGSMANGEILLQGTYYYIIRFNIGESRIKHGSILLLK